MHATPISGVGGSGLCILQHRGLPNRHAVVKGIRVVQKTMASHKRNCTWRQTFEVLPHVSQFVCMSVSQLTQTIKTHRVCGGAAWNRSAYLGVYATR